MLMRIIGLLLLVLSTLHINAQSCTTLGQTPSTAFPVCGTSTFNQANVPICSSHNLVVPGCNSTQAAYQDKNPFWYSFTCYTTGTLGFLITPKDLGDDYDWMLYDITGHNPDEVFTNTSLVVTGNWAGTYGKTGASSFGVNYIQCGSDPKDNKNSFSSMPTLIAGHQYLLLVSHFTDSQSGYDLSFGGGTAVITDPKLPQLAGAEAGCGGITVKVFLNKKMKCSSLATDGSDFSLSPAVGNIIAAKGNTCSTGFDMDTLVLTMNNALPPGTYTLTAKNGSDNNTLLDNCNRNISVGDHVTFTVIPIQPTPLDSITPVGCSPKTLQLVFRKPMLCSSIAPNGSDFVVTGPTNVTITGASGNCGNGQPSRIITLQLAAPIQTGGTYQVRLLQGNDGNTIIDECGQATPAGSAISFIAGDTVNADFSYQLLYGCKTDTVNFSHNGDHFINNWNWNFNNEGSSTAQNPTCLFTKFGSKNIRLIVSNGVCKDTADQVILLDNELKAVFGFPEVVCPEDAAAFTDSSIGKIISWNWNFGNGSVSTQQNPSPFKYPQVTVGRSTLYTVQLVVENDLHCFDTVKHQVKSVYTCFIAVPNGFTPNNDGKNDYLYPLNAYKAKNLVFNIYNRYGQLVFHTTDWTKKWDGTINGYAQPTGVYAWTLNYTDGDTGQKVFKKGTTVLIR